MDCDGEIIQPHRDNANHGQMAVSKIEFMNDNLYSRAPFTYRELEAAQWIVDTLLAMGHPAGNIEMQTFNRYDMLHQVWHHWTGPAANRIWGDMTLREYSQNVILTIPGHGRSESKIIVGAHYDTLPYPGASDNASGTALLLESAYHMLGLNNYHTIVYVFFGAEEIGLVGAQYYLDSLSPAQRSSIAFMVNADVLFEGPYLLYIVGGHNADDVSRLSASLDEIAEQKYARHGFELIPYPDGIHIWFSDHKVFYWEGFPTVTFFGMDRIEKEGAALEAFWGTTFVSRVLHSPRDCFHYINQNWPGKIDRAMRAYSLFLEEILLMEFSN